MKLSKTPDEITEELKAASAEMIRSLENDELVDTEKVEWYGYLRAIRDIALFMGVSEQTKAQENLYKALQYVMPETPFTQPSNKSKE